ncbi:MAG: precorrin-6Y C5,15-methyltransferase (decarboxylating) subunit CbiT [Lachnospiraceae bacterium]|nr:precorrin-6Y C5,15-methyltransferase (decarboxylating) subunit CbiT [Lachnospiraceae bacterium]
MSILIFGGTIEGRQVSEYLVKRHIRHTICVATEYGEEVLRTGITEASVASHPSSEALAGNSVGADEAKDEFTASGKEGKEWRTVHQGRMDAEQMRAFLRANSFALVVDATHPYAVEVSKNIREACQKEQVPYVRYLRPEENRADEDSCAGLSNIAGGNRASDDSDMAEANCMAESGNHPIYVKSTLEAAEYLETREGGIFLTTGSKELHVFTEHISDKSRLFARVLPSAEVITSCRSLGLEGKQICAMQGPFSAEINTAMLRQTHASFLVTKETGASGGYPEKLEAVRECRITAVVIRRPKESGAGWDEVRARIDEALAGTDEGAGALKCSAAKGKNVAEDTQTVRISAEMKNSMPEENDAAMRETDAAETRDNYAAGTCEKHTASIREKQAAEPDEKHRVTDSGRRISCIGIGMGTPDTMTREAAREIRSAQVIFGAKRMLECAGELVSDTDAPQMVAEYSARKIYDWLEAHPDVQRASILMSGDVGFYSGARQIAEVFPRGEVRYYCGISSVVYFASRIPTSWQDAKLLSAHGKDLALTNYVKKYPKIILLVSGEKDISRLCRQLVHGGMTHVQVTIGANLSYPDEWIDRGEPGDFLDYASDVQMHREKLLQAEECSKYEGIRPASEGAFGMAPLRLTEMADTIRAASSIQVGITEDIRTALPEPESKRTTAGLYVMMVENTKGSPVITPGIPDQEFVRGDVPMTKEEIRALSIAKLRLKEDSIVFDIGAGTGSVSIECALLCTAGQVYAIERNPSGTDLIRRNNSKFGVDNLSIIEGTAPEALQKLPAPTHAFIGGSSGNICEIIETLLEKNPSVRIVINTVTLESIAEVMNLIRKLHRSDADIVQISAAKSRTLGSYHLMTAHNPVYIVSFGGDA